LGLLVPKPIPFFLVFTLKSESVTMFILIYVDDIIITTSTSSAIDDLLQQLCIEFAIKDLGPINFFLVVEVIPLQSGSSIITKKVHYRSLKEDKYARSQTKILSYVFLTYVISI
jgi:hypothetical protein